MNVHILLPVFRPENVPAIRATVAAARERAPGVIEVVWHISHDPDGADPSSYRQRNRMLDEIDDDAGWLWFLDDDTLAHPRILETLWQHRQAEALVVAQTRPSGWDDGCADPAKIRNGADGPLGPGLCAFDIGQALVRRRLVGDYRFRVERAGDGYFWDEILSQTPGVVYVDEVLAYYNALRP